MLPSKGDALLFVARFAVIFAVLIAPWPHVGEVFSIGFSIASTTALETFVDERDVVARFAPPPHPKAGLEEWNVEFTATDVHSGRSTQLPFDARGLAYVPFATLVALAFATPLERGRRRLILLGGSALLVVRLVLAIALPLAVLFRTIGPQSAAASVAQAVFRALIEPPDMTYATPVVAFLVGLLFTSASQTPAARTAAPLRRPLRAT